VIIIYKNKTYISWYSIYVITIVRVITIMIIIMTIATSNIEYNNITIIYTTM
jgi:hypothetical protein